MDLHIAIGESRMQVTKLNIHDAADMLATERVKDNNIVDSVNEFGAEMLRNDFHKRGFHCLVVFLAGEFLNHLGPEIRRHDDHCVAEIDGTALAIGQSAVIKDLQQYVEHIGMCFFDLVEQDNRIRATTNRFCQVTAFLVADIARRGTDESRNRVLLHELGHVETNHRIICIEQKVGQCLA